MDAAIATFTVGWHDKTLFENKFVLSVGCIIVHGNMDLRGTSPNSENRFLRAVLRRDSNKQPACGLGRLQHLGPRIVGTNVLSP